MAYIITKDISFQYKSGKAVLSDTNIVIERSKLTAILGNNGCGKSTLIKLIAGLLPVSSGLIIVNGYDINSKDGIKYIRNNCGIVFQNPENQFVSPVIEDDIKFGLKNHNVSKNEYSYRIKNALNNVHLTGYEDRSVNTLSGGQKQRAAIAGILALNPEIIIFDEACSMLDPQGRDEIINCIHSLRNQNKTIIIITQNIEDVIDADYVYIIANHTIASSGTPSNILTDFKLLHNSGIQIPFSVRVYHDLKESGIILPFCPVNIKQAAEVICSCN